MSLKAPTQTISHNTPPRKTLRRRASSIISSLTTSFSLSGLSTEPKPTSFQGHVHTPIVITPAATIRTRIELHQLSARAYTHHQTASNRRRIRPSLSDNLSSVQLGFNLPEASQQRPSPKPSLFQHFFDLRSPEKSNSKSITSMHPNRSKPSTRSHPYHYTRAAQRRQELECAPSSQVMRGRSISVSLEQVIMTNVDPDPSTQDGSLAFVGDRARDMLMIEEVEDSLNLFSPTARATSMRRQLASSSEHPPALVLKKEGAQSPDFLQFTLLSPQPMIYSSSSSSGVTSNVQTPKEAEAIEGNGPMVPMIVEEVMETPHLSRSAGADSLDSFYSSDSGPEQHHSDHPHQPEQRLQMTFQNRLVNFDPLSSSSVERFRLPTVTTSQSHWSLLPAPGTELSPLPSSSTSHSEAPSLRKKLSQGFKDTLGRHFRRV